MEARGWHDVVRSQGMPEAVRNWKSRGTHSLLDPVVGTSPWFYTLVLALQNSFQTVSLPKCQRINLYYAPCVWVICQRSNGKLIWRLHCFRDKGTNVVPWIEVWPAQEDKWVLYPFIFWTPEKNGKMDNPWMRHFTQISAKWKVKRDMLIDERETWNHIPKHLRQEIAENCPEHPL